MHPDFLKRHQPAPPPEQPATKRPQWSEAVPLSAAPKPVKEPRAKTGGTTHKGPHHWVKNGFSKEGRPRKRCTLCPASVTA